MARRHKHEEHVNHEAWAIPYADLMTLLLAFFVVMYAMSSINEGKYRVLSDSLAAAFQGSPKTMQPIQVGHKQVGSGADVKVSLVQQGMMEGQPRSLLQPLPLAAGRDPKGGQNTGPKNIAKMTGNLGAPPVNLPGQAELEQVALDIERAMQPLIDADLIAVRRHRRWVEVEIRTDILFPSGVATLSTQAQTMMEVLGQTLKPYPNPIRVEGHTDNVPINTRQFPSNWELSAARAGTVVHLFTRIGIAPARLAVIGLGEHRPAASNDTSAGRNANRRVVLVVMNSIDSTAPEGEHAPERGDEIAVAAAAPQPVPADLEGHVSIARNAPGD